MHLSQKSKQMGLSNFAREPCALDLAVGARRWVAGEDDWLDV